MLVVRRAVAVFQVLSKRFDKEALEHRVMVRKLSYSDVKFSRDSFSLSASAPKPRFAGFHVPYQFPQFPAQRLWRVWRERRTFFWLFGGMFGHHSSSIVPVYHLWPCVYVKAAAVYFQRGIANIIAIWYCKIHEKSEGGEDFCAH